MTTIASGSSAVVTVTSNQQIAINSAPGVRCDIEATSGVPGSASKVKLATHRGGFGIYGPFGAGTVTLGAIGGSVDYDATDPIGSADARSPVQTNSAGAIIGLNAATRRRQNSVLARCLTGRSRALALSDASFPANSNANGVTIRQRVALATDFDSVRLHIPNMHTSTVAGFKAALGVTATLGAWATTAPSANNTGADTAAAPSNTEAVNSSGGALLAVTFGAASTVTLPVALNTTNLLPSYTSSDWMPIKSIPRTDGGTLPLLDVVLFYPAGTTATMAYTGASGTAWAMWGRDDTPSNGRVWRSWMLDGDCITTPANFTEDTTTATLCPIIIEYRAKTAGYTVYVSGDSIYDAHNVTYPQDGFAHKAVSTILHSTSMPVELCNVAVPGATTMAQLERANVLVPLLKPGVIVAEASSVNNYGASLGTRVQQHGEGTAGGFIALAADNQAALVLCSMFPVTNAAKAWGSTDAQRITLNTNLGARTDDFVFLDWGPVTDGVTTSGQVEPVASRIQADGIHFDDTGHTDMRIPFAEAVKAAVRRYFGWLV